MLVRMAQIVTCDQMRFRMRARLALVEISLTWAHNPMVRAAPYLIYVTLSLGSVACPAIAG
jgi:hypothetical protein